MVLGHSVHQVHPTYLFSILDLAVVQQGTYEAQRLPRYTGEAIKGSRPGVGLGLRLEKQGIISSAQTWLGPAHRLTPVNPNPDPVPDITRDKVRCRLPHK